MGGSGGGPPPPSIGFAPGFGADAFTSMPRNHHAAAHRVEAGVLPRWNPATAALFQREGVALVENPVATFDHQLRGPIGVKGFYGQINGRDVVLMIFKTGPDQGKVATALVPSAAQKARW